MFSHGGKEKDEALRTCFSDILLYMYSGQRDLIRSGKPLIKLENLTPLLPRVKTYYENLVLSLFLSCMTASKIILPVLHKLFPADTWSGGHLHPTVLRPLYESSTVHTWFLPQGLEVRHGFWQRSSMQAILAGQSRSTRHSGSMGVSTVFEKGIRNQKWLPGQNTGLIEVSDTI